MNGHSDLREEFLLLLLINDMNYTLGVNRVTKTNFGPLYLLCNLCGASHSICKCFGPNFVSHSHGLGGTKRHHFLALFCLTHIISATSKFKHTLKYPDLPSANRLVPHIVQKPLENLILKNTKDSKRAQCWLRTDICSKLFLIWTCLVNTRRS